MNAQPQHEDYSTYSEFWREQIDEMARILGSLGDDTALEVLRKAAISLGGWTPELQALGLRLLKPTAEWEVIVAA
jgi:hypothetical protein